MDRLPAWQGAATGTVEIENTANERELVGFRVQKTKDSLAGKIRGKPRGWDPLSNTTPAQLTEQ
jgi:hypothetical protein